MAIDLGATQEKAGRIKSLLGRRGLPTDINSAIAFLAGTIRDHKHLESLLTGIDAKERQMMYDSIVPHLRFTAKPLDKYIASAGQRAEAEQWPILGPDGNLLPFKPAADVSSVNKDVEQMLSAAMAKRTLTLTCSKCTRQQQFHAIGEETRVAVVIRARKAGWIYDYLTNPPREICPKCPSSLRATPNHLPQPSDL